MTDPPPPSPANTATILFPSPLGQTSTTGRVWQGQTVNNAPDYVTPNEDRLVAEHAPVHPQGLVSITQGQAARLYSDWGDIYNMQHSSNTVLILGAAASFR